MTAIIYYGVPPSKNSGGFVRFIDSDDPSDQGHALPPKHVNKRAYAWGFVVAGGRQTKAMVPGAAPLALAICCHALADESRGLAIYQRFKMRVMDKWPADQPWAISAEEVAAIADKIEADELTPEELQRIERERVVPESETGPGVQPHMGGIVWDTDEHGHWIKPRGSE